MIEKDIAQMGEQCIQESPVFCSNECPVSVDVRQIMQKVQKGDWNGAFKLYQKQVIFPDIISRICDEPCKNACIRKNLDDAISIKLIERACSDYTTNKDVQKYTMPPKKGRIAVIGGGLSGLTCAINMSRKSYDVTVYEENSVLGGRLLFFPKDVLPPEITNDTFKKVLKDEDIKFKLNTQINSLSELIDFDTVLVATGFGGSTFDLELKDNCPVFDTVSLQASRENVFVAGGVLKDNKDYSPIFTIAESLKATKSLERFLKGSSLTSGREDEGFKPTSLITKTDDINICPKVVPSSEGQGFTKEEATEEAKRCILCECKTCVKNCDFLAHYRSYPRKYVQDIMQTVTALDGISKHISTRFINSCNLCGLCSEVCPTDVDMGEICVSSRRLLHREGHLPPAFHDLWLRDMDFAFGYQANLSINPPDKEKCDFIFFPGCQLGASDPMYVTETYNYLRDKLNDNVALSLDCCGAPAAWSGNYDIHDEVLDRIKSDLKSLGGGKVILACPSCVKMFKRYLPEFETISLWQIIDKYGLPENMKNGENKKIAVFDPCQSRYDPDTQASIRNILKKSDFDVNELPHHGINAQCCSYGGLIYSANPSLAEEIAHKRIEQSPLPYVAYCTNCRDTFATCDKDTWYILDLLFAKDDTDKRSKRSAPTLSERKQNRILLKKTILKDVLGEDMKIEKQDFENIKIKISDELLNKIEKNLISVDDVKNVIFNAEKTNNKLSNENNNSFIAHLQQGIITYWVEYQPLDDEFKILNSYCHRLQIREEYK